jgi:hypothetical protein
LERKSVFLDWVAFQNPQNFVLLALLPDVVRKGIVL